MHSCFRFVSFLPVFIVVMMIVAGVPATSHGATGTAQDHLVNALDAGAAEGQRVFDRAALQDFYSARDYQPLWHGTAQKNENAGKVLEIFKSSWTHGLNPETYHTEILRRLRGGHQDEKSQAALEILMSDGIVRYGRDVTGIRIKSSDLRTKEKYWRQADTPEAILAAIGAAKNPVTALESFPPQVKLYNILRAEMVRLNRDEEDYDHLLPMTFGSHHFVPRSKHRDVAALRQRLGVPHRGEDPYYYDDDLASAVMTFQKKHGLDPDGIIGPQTAGILNRTKKAQMEQVAVNLERLRWLERERPNRYVKVNIPSQMLWAIENEKVVEQMRVVVGMPWRQTKSYQTNITGVRFNPTWTVPLSIKMEDFLPRLREDPGYLVGKNIDLLRGFGRDAVTLDPYAVDWHSVGWREMGELRMVQRPGSHNALGRIRILMPSDYDIYLHDTNHPEFFAREQRLLSSGCIRLAEPERLAHFIMGREPGWSDQVMRDYFATGKMVDVPISQPFPVYILYQTMWLDDKGRLVYGSDVYKQDQKLVELLAAMDGYYLPTGPDQLYAGFVGKLLASNQ